MARRSDHTREELYTLAIDAARQIVAEEGGRALTARRVADAIGYSPGTLYNLFANLDEMILHVNARTLEDLAKSLSGVKLKGDGDKDFKALLKCYLAFEAANTNLWTLMFEFTFGGEGGLPDWYLPKINGALEPVEQALASALPGAKGKERRLAAQTLWACLHGITSLAKSGKLELVAGIDVDTMAKHFVMTYLAGLKTQP